MIGGHHGPILICFGEQERTCCVLKCHFKKIFHLGVGFMRESADVEECSAMMTDASSIFGRESPCLGHVSSGAKENSALTGPGSHASVVGVMMVRRLPQGAVWQAQLCGCRCAPARWLGSMKWFGTERFGPRWEQRKDSGGPGSSEAHWSQRPPVEFGFDDPFAGKSGFAWFSLTHVSRCHHQLCHLQWCPWDLEQWWMGPL